MGFPALCPGVPETKKKKKKKKKKKIIIYVFLNIHFSKCVVLL